jgi:hypothetical protein
MTTEIQNFLDRIWDMAAAGLLSLFGGTAAYVYKTVRDDTGFKFGPFFVNAFLAFFIGNMIGGFIPKDASYRDGLLMLAGFSTWPILGVMEFYGKRAVLKYIDKAIGINASGVDREMTQANEKKTTAKSTNSSLVSEIAPPARRSRKD